MILQDKTSQHVLQIVVSVCKTFFLHRSVIIIQTADHTTTALWRTYPPTTNYGHLTTLHKAAILDLQWSLCSSLLYTVSADHTLLYTDVTTGQRVRKIRAHRGVINALDRTVAGGAGVELVATASDDKTVHVWEGGDEGSKQAVATLEVGSPVTAVCWSADGTQVFAAALDNEIHVSDFQHSFLTHSD